MRLRLSAEPGTSKLKPFLHYITAIDPLVISVVIKRKKVIKHAVLCGNAVAFMPYSQLLAHAC